MLKASISYPMLPRTWQALLKISKGLHVGVFTAFV